VALGIPGRLRPRIFSTFGTTRVVGRQPNAPAAFIPGEIPGTHFQRLSLPQGTWFCRKEPRKKSQVTPPWIDPGTVRMVAHRLNHYASPGQAIFSCWTHSIVWLRCVRFIGERTNTCGKDVKFNTEMLEPVSLKTGDQLGT
jgi:hypothetical protein